MSMHKVVIVFVVTILFFGFSLGSSFGLQQIAGKLEAVVSPGESTIIEWGLISDNPSKTISVDLRSEGPGSEFLSFPEKVQLEPRQVKFVQVTVSIPDNHKTDIVFNPSIFAVEKGEEGGPTVINIQMKKILTITIPPQPIVFEEIPQAQEQESKPITKQEQESKPITQQEQESSGPECGPGTVLKDGLCVPTPSVQASSESTSRGGGCLIATATFGSELAPQVQQLRELRDNSLLQTESGRSFMESFNSFYYSFSPGIADLERENPVFKEAVKLTITPLLSSLSLLNYVDMDSEAEVLGYGISLILLNVGMYFVLPAVVIHRIRKFV